MSKIRNLHYLKSFGYEFFGENFSNLNEKFYTLNSLKNTNLSENSHTQNPRFSLKNFNKNFKQNLSKNLANLSKFKTMQQKFINLRADIEKCELCTLSKKRKNSLIEKEFKPCKMMIISNFADKSEDESGIILNSTRGDLLKSMINEALGEINFYQSYIYKCFNAHKNDASALFQCLPYFWAEFELISPRVLLILGQDCFENLGFKDFQRVRGAVFSHFESKIIATYSIEFIEKNPSHKADFMGDLSKIKAFL